MSSAALTSLPARPATQIAPHAQAASRPSRFTILRPSHSSAGNLWRDNRHLALGPHRLQVNSSAAGSAGGSPSGKQFVEKVEDIKAVIGDVLPRSRQDLKIELGISKLAVYNFGVQAALTLVSWAVLFATLHHNIGKGVSIISFPTVANLVGVVLSAFSAFTSYTYVRKVKRQGEEALDGFAVQKQMFDHLRVNFFGAAAAIVGLQAEVGTLFSSALFGAAIAPAAASSGVAFAQAAANTITAHLVSLAFLCFMIQKITIAHKKLVDWSNELKATMSKLR